MTFTGNWDAIFRDTERSLCIANTKPPGGRNCYADDSEEIHAAAKRHGFKFISKPTDKSVSFVKIK